jgi:hypothetical protein
MILALLLASAVIPPSGEEPYKQPQIAVHGEQVALAFGSARSIFFIDSKDGGRTFSEPRKVAEVRTMALGRHRGPRIVLTGKAMLVSAITGIEGGGRDGDLNVWRSADRGQTWAGPIRVNDVPSATREGLHAMAGGPNGMVVAVWLDLRQKGTRLYGSVSRDDGATWSPNMLVYESPSGTICQCCHPSVSISAEGKIAVMFRNALDGSRDLYTITSTDGGKTYSAASKSGTGTWKIDACPMDGGGLAYDGTGKPVAIWRRESEIYLSRAPGKEERLGAGKDAALASTGNRVTAGWTAGDGVHLWREPPGSGSGSDRVLDPKGAFLQLAPLADGSLIAAWERDGAIRFERID